MGDTKRRPRVLMLAYACSPYRGSESSVGWNRAAETAKYCDVTLLTETNEFGTDIDRFLAEQGEIPGLEFQYVPLLQWERKMGDRASLWYLALNLWQRRALRVARQLHADNPFDLVHHVTFCGYREPGYLWKLDAPFVWGPVGGTQNYPNRFLHLAGLRGGLGEAWRSLVNTVQLRFSPRVRRVLRRADAFLTASSENARDFARVHGVTPIQMFECGIPDQAIMPRELARTDGPLRIFWAGVHQPWKALSLLLYALAQLPESVKYELRVLSEGPLTPKWKRLAQRLGIDEHITWVGWLDQHEYVLEQRKWADVFAFTSLRDTSGNVILESLAANVPVICLDHQGAHDIVTDECGLKVPVGSPAEVVAGLRDAVQRLAHDRELLARLSAGAGRRIQEYTWSRQGRRMIDVYRQVLGDGFEWPADEPNNTPAPVAWEAAPGATDASPTLAEGGG